MRLLSTLVKLVTVDEPSSALDPAGEFKLFSHLRAARNGRTMIFVTHRFGHLTKHADLIMCVPCFLTMCLGKEGADYHFIVLIVDVSKMGRLLKLGLTRSCWQWTENMRIYIMFRPKHFHLRRRRIS